MTWQEAYDAFTEEKLVRIAGDAREWHVDRVNILNTNCSVDLSSAKGEKRFRVPAEKLHLIAR